MIMHIDSNASKPYIMTFDENEIFMEIYISDTVLHNVSMACTKIQIPSLPKWPK